MTKPRPPKLVDDRGQFLIPVVYSLRTPDGDRVEPAAPGDPVEAPSCPHCGGPVPLRPEPDVIDPTTGQFLLTVRTDTREQRPYTFEGIAWDRQDGGGPGKTLQITTVEKKLPIGDYSLLGYETRVGIERKSWEDAVGTLGRGRDRFERTMEKSRSYQFYAIVIEQDWDTLSTKTPVHSQLSPKVVVRSLMTFMVRYGVHVIPAGPRRLAEVTTFRLLERFAKDHM